MKRIFTLGICLLLIVCLACPTFAATLESSVTSGDTITDTYTEDEFSYNYEVEATDGIIARQEPTSGSSFTVNLPESVYLGGRFSASTDITIGDDYIGSSARCETQIAVIGECSYHFYLYVSCDRAYGDIEDVPLGFYDYEGYVYESQEFVELSLEFELPSDVSALYFDIVFPNIYALWDSNVYIEVSPITFEIVRNRVERYEPNATDPGNGVGDELDKAEQDAMDKVQDGADAFEDLHIGVLDTILTCATSFLAVGALLDVFLELDFVDNLLTISLAVGSFALLLGLAINLTRRDE